MSLSNVSFATPQRKLPGGFVQTPAPPRMSQPLLARSSSTNALQLERVDPTLQARQLAPLRDGDVQAQSVNNVQPQELSPVSRAARTINETLGVERRYPELEGYVGQGYSADYDLSDNTAWAPFQRVKNYDIPEQIFDQANLSQVSTSLGLFAELNHAYIVIDSSLYLWDYTHPAPELIGYEENSAVITAVKLVKPRPGVFVPAITHLLVVATNLEITLIGLATQSNQAGGYAVSLYNTRMSVPIKGISCNSITASAKSGRIFFGGRASNDVWELTYQQEERWFKSRCDKINHTLGTLGTFTTWSVFSTGTSVEHIIDMQIDDTRDILYTLSSKSTIRLYQLKAGNILTHTLDSTLPSLMNNIGHMIPRSEILGQNTKIVSISPITSTESTRLSLQALTSSGCRMFLSAVSSSYYSSSSSSPPTSIQVHHVKFPPRHPSSPTLGHPTAQPSSQLQTTNTSDVDVNSRRLTTTSQGVRFAPGFNLWVVKSEQDPSREQLFLAAPESGRIKDPKDPSQPTKYPEAAQWLSTSSTTQAIGLMSPTFAAATTPPGFANELAVQYDVPATEIAILSGTGVQTLRRRRLVDVFAAAVRMGGDSDGRQNEAKKFIRLYGRAEAAATALAVACGQGSEVTLDERIAHVTEPETLEFAREIFIQHGGKPTLNENTVVDNTAAIDNVRTSPRHDGMALYVSRLVRSIWNAPILHETLSPQGGLQVISTIPRSKLQEIQRALNALQEFLTKNKSSIEGLAGPDALGRASTKQEEIALQGEHRAMNALVQLISSIIEGIAFVLVLFEERVEEIVVALAPESRQRVRQLSFEGLFASGEGRDLAKELVKAIVNRNIANGSNVDTVAEALRRKCGSVCSADDVVIFKAQEQVKRASESGANSEQGRVLLNESLRLFQKVAGALSHEHLELAVVQYNKLEFFAGAIQLALSVAQESDRANRALSWLRDDCPDNDPRKDLFAKRKQCYDLIHHTITSVDQTTAGLQEGQQTIASKRRAEAYEVINDSRDEVFQNNLYDWYISQGWEDRLLDITSPVVITYLRRRMEKDPAHADLLWKFYAHHDNFLEAASVQLLLAKSSFDINLEGRITYLSRARTNASIRTTSLLDSRQSRHQLLREISDLLDVASIQAEILQRMKTDSRLTETRRPQVLQQLDGSILDVGELFNQYADLAHYYDICILIYQVADHRNAADIQNSWQSLVEQVHQRAEAAGETPAYQAVAREVKDLGTRLRLADATFPVPILLPILERYALEFQRSVGPDTWVVDLFLDLEVPREAIVSALEQLYYANEPPFQGKNRRVLASGLVYVISHWFSASQRDGDRIIFGSEENVAGVEELLVSLIKSGELVGSEKEDAETLRTRIAQAMR